MIKINEKNVNKDIKILYLYNNYLIHLQLEIEQLK